MPIAIACPGCSKRYDLGDEAAGKTAKCKQCGQVFQVPVPRHLSERQAAAPQAARPETPVRPSPPNVVPSRPAAPVPAQPKAPAQPKPPATAPRPAPSPPRASNPTSSLYDELMDDDGAEDEALSSAYAARRRSYRRASDTRWVKLTVASVGLLAGLAVGGYGIYLALQGVSNHFSGVGGGGPAIAANPGAGNVGDAGAMGSWPVLPFASNDMYPAGTNPASGAKPPVRADVVSRGTESVRKMVGLFRRMSSILAGVKDGPSAQAATGQLQQLSMEGNQLSQQAHQIQPSPAENRAIFKNVSGEFRGAIAELRTQAERLQSVPGAAVGTSQMIHGLNMMASAFEEMMKQADAPYAPTRPYVEVYIADVPDSATSAVLVDQLKTVAPRAETLSTWGASVRATAVRLAPVADARQFAASIPFGKADVSGYRVVVLKPSVDPAAVASRKADLDREEANHAAEATARQQEERNRKEREDPTPPPNADATQLALTKLTSSNTFKQKEALESLAAMRPDPKHLEEVVQAAEPFATGRDHFAAKEAVRVLTNWKSDAGWDILIHVVDRSDDVFLRRETIKQLADEKVIRGSDAIARRLNDDWPTAEEALRSLGSGAESGVIPMLAHGNSQLRGRACEVLRDIGGKAALEAMLRLPADSDPFVQQAATAAMNAITQRLDPETVTAIRKAARDRPAR